MTMGGTDPPPRSPPISLDTGSTACRADTAAKTSAEAPTTTTTALIISGTPAATSSPKPRAGADTTRNTPAAADFGFVTKPSHCLSQNARCLSRNAHCLGRNARCLSRNAHCLSRNAHCLSRNAHCLGRNARCLSRSAPCFGRSASCDARGAISLLCAVRCLLLPNVKEHAPLSAAASVDNGVGVETTEGHENRAADRGCCVSSCSLLLLFMILVSLVS